MGLLKFLLFIGLVLIFLKLSIMVSTTQHESVHQAIYKMYGVNTHVKYYFFSFRNDGIQGQTIPDNSTIANKNCTDNCKLAHNYNEVISYNIDAVIIAMFMIFTLWLFYDYLKEKDKKP